jgi:hypothetical protein
MTILILCGGTAHAFELFGPTHYQWDHGYFQQEIYRRVSNGLAKNLSLSEAWSKILKTKQKTQPLRSISDGEGIECRVPRSAMSCTAAYWRSTCSALPTPSAACVCVGEGKLDRVHLSCLRCTRVDDQASRAAAYHSHGAKRRGRGEKKMRLGFGSGYFVPFGVNVSRGSAPSRWRS